MKASVLSDLLAAIDAQRIASGYMSVVQLLEASTASQNVFLDPFSTLVSCDAQMGSGNLFYPNVVIEVTNGGKIVLGSNNVFYPGTLLQADQGTITIGDGNELGSGGLQIKANRPDAAIEIGDQGRYMNAAEIMGRCLLGSGSQILGPITVQNCHLQAGDSYKGTQPETRAGLLKGFGLARNLTVKRGEVINGQGNFSDCPVEQQAAYHPKQA